MGKFNFEMIRGGFSVCIHMDWHNVCVYVCVCVWGGSKWVFTVVCVSPFF